MSPTPPRLPHRLLRWALRYDPAADAVLGDLLEDYAGVERSRGRTAARLWYWREALPLASGILLRSAYETLFDPDTGTMNDRSFIPVLIQDATYAARTLRRAPGFSLFTAVIIGLGVGATTSVFSVLKPLMLAPLPFEDPGELVWVANSGYSGNNSLSAVTSRSSNLRDFREQTRSFDGLAGYNAFFDQEVYTLSGEGPPERLTGVAVTDDFLDVLGVRPVQGRDFTVEEGQWGGPAAVILTHGFWQRRFAGDATLVGNPIILNGEPRTVVGVLPPTFDFSSVFSPGVPADFLLTWPVSDETDRTGNSLVIVGRLRPGATPQSAQADLDAVIQSLQEAQPDRWGLGARLTPLQEHLAGPFRGALLLLAAAAATVLLIVCVNVSSLMLARMPRRSREIAVRKALGASRGRLVRQLVIESLGISVLGAALGAGLAWMVTGMVAQTAAVRIPLMSQAGVDGQALLFGIGVAVFTGLVVGVAPAVRVTEGGEAGIMREASRGSSAGRGSTRLRETLVVGELALACGLLVVGGLLLRSFSAVLDVDLGFESENAVAWQLNPSQEFEDLQEIAAFFDAVTDRVTQIPGVQSAGLIDALPLGRSRSWGFGVPGRTEGENSRLSLYPHIIDDHYLATMGIPLVEGRTFTPADDEEAPVVVLINETGARRAFPGESALGKSINLFAGESKIVGIVRDVHHLSPELDAGIEMYFHMDQVWSFSTLDLVVRTTRPTDETADAVAVALRELDPGMPTRDYWTLDTTLDRAVAARRFTLGILSAFGIAALLLAALGIYGVLAQSVAERTPEIGIRMALGASSGDVVRSVIGRTLILAGAGVVLGTGLALWGSRMVGSLLFGVGTADPVTFVGMGALLLGVAVLAATLPAARAARTRGVRALQAN